MYVLRQVARREQPVKRRIVPNPYVLPFKGIPLVDWRAWRTMHGDVSPGARNGVRRMLEGIVRYGPV